MTPQIDSHIALQSHSGFRSRSFDTDHFFSKSSRSFSLSVWSHPPCASLPLSLSHYSCLSLSQVCSLPIWLSFSLIWTTQINAQPDCMNPLTHIILIDHIRTSSFSSCCPLSVSLLFIQMDILNSR
ncbi:hypothetical protein D915_007385 [Fasciola hepatica]|uniref:Uncharacterized protein n=1 Tax=Fasciola hepatica TaxID=6192 RepID=A0A4E0QYD0_FASHE|nr:hypothetical protein D915_007385 [Fasciola hepatica]